MNKNVFRFIEFVFYAQIDNVRDKRNLNHIQGPKLIHSLRINLHARGGGGKAFSHFTNPLSTTAGTLMACRSIWQLNMQK